MTMDEPKTTNDWRQLELDVGRLFSAAPFSPVGSLDHGSRQELYPGRDSEMRLMMHAVRDPAKQILLYGERSLGKTSLSNTFWRNRTSDQPVLAARVQAGIARQDVGGDATTLAFEKSGEKAGVVRRLHRPRFI